MNPLWVLRTARLVLTPVGGSDLPDLRAMKGDPRVFAIMLGGVRSPQQTAEELAEEVASWGAEGFGTWAVRDAKTGQFLGITGLERRHDGRGIALRFAVWPEVQGHGLAREAAAAALRIRSPAGWFGTNCRRGAREQFRLEDCAGRHWYDRVRQLCAARVPDGAVRKC